MERSLQRGDISRSLADPNPRVEEIRDAVEMADLTALTVIHNQGRLSAYGSGLRFGIIYDAIVLTKQ